MTVYTQQLENIRKIFISHISYDLVHSGLQNLIDLKSPLAL